MASDNRFGAATQSSQNAPVDVNGIAKRIFDGLYHFYQLAA
jgi:hypothetical protein